MIALFFAEAFAADPVAGDYGELSLAVHDDQVSGLVQSVIGDPAQGGATCGFVLSGRLTAGNVPVLARDGYESVLGQLSVLGPDTISVQLPTLPNACARMFPSDEFAAGYRFSRTGPLPDGVVEFRVVGAEKAYFHAKEGGAARKAYVVKGDAVTVLAGGSADWLKVSYTPITGGRTTTGYLAVGDLLGGG